jgi:orotate phosphoribosyltransferase
MSHTEKQLLETLERVGAIIQNSHIVYTSGRHGSAYVNKDAIYPHTQVTSHLCWNMAEHFRDGGVDVVLAPAVGGIILSQWVAHHLTEMCQREILGVYAEKGTEASAGTEAEFVIKRGYDKLIAGKNVLVVEDILTTGGSVKKVVEVIRQTGAQVIGVGAICNRGEVTREQLGSVPELFSLVHIALQSWEEKNCPLCSKKVPINTSVGKGAEFLKRHPSV